MFKTPTILATVAVLGLAACAQNTNSENALIGAGARAAASALSNQSDRDTALAAAGCTAAGALANDLGISQ
jgi:hypothetical protein